LPKNRHLRNIVQICRAIFATEARIGNWKKLVKQQYLLQMSSKCGELGPLTAEIGLVVWGTPANLTGFAYWQRYCTALQYWASAELCGMEQR